ncbi:MAG: hypothetical protein Q8K82_24385 [Gemmatimonadaceae bacterium]|nr:hypothetical protein [Gemmatimonadaceae bacterium]
MEIPTPDGGVRMFGIPTVVDRFIQPAVLQVLQPQIDPTFSECSFGRRDRPFEGERQWPAREREGVFP